MMNPRADEDISNLGVCGADGLEDADLSCAIGDDHDEHADDVEGRHGENHEKHDGGAELLEP